MEPRSVPPFGKDLPDLPAEGVVEEAGAPGGGDNRSSGAGSAAASPSPRPLLLRRLPSDPALAARVSAIPDEHVAAVKAAALAAAPDLFSRADQAAAADADEAAAAGSAPADPSSAGAALLSCATLNRFLRAAGGDVQGAADRLVATARWRAGRLGGPGGPGGPCPLCVTAPGSHYMQVRKMREEGNV
jgi:hypothetical protein